MHVNINAPLWTANLHIGKQHLLLKNNEINVLNIYRLLNVLLEKKNDFRYNEQDSQDQFTLNKLRRIAVKDGELTNCKFANLMKFF